MQSNLALQTKMKVACGKISLKSKKFTQIQMESIFNGRFTDYYKQSKF